MADIGSCLIGFVQRPGCFGLACARYARGWLLNRYPITSRKALNTPPKHRTAPTPKPKERPDLLSDGRAPTGTYPPINN
jgi:hypothetical protein